MSDAHPTPTTHRFVDLTGLRSGHILVLRYDGYNKHGHRMWWCRCDCGKERSVIGPELTRRNEAALRRFCSRQCPFFRSEVIGQLTLTHGHSGTPEFYAWVNIRNRCYRPKTHGFQDYGGRGITVCQGWRESFENFLASMGDRPSSKYSIDRIDTNQGYNCGRCDECKHKGHVFNCRWASISQQTRNKRNNIMITVNGETLCFKDWATRLGLCRATIEGRLERGWSLEAAVTTPRCKPGPKPKKQTKA